MPEASNCQYQIRMDIIGHVAFFLFYLSLPLTTSKNGEMERRRLIVRETICIAIGNSIDSGYKKI